MEAKKSLATFLREVIEKYSHSMSTSHRKFLFRLLHTEKIVANISMNIFPHSLLHADPDYVCLHDEKKKKKNCLPLEKSLGRQIFDMRCLTTRKEANICTRDEKKNIELWVEETIKRLRKKKKASENVCFFGDISDS